MRIFVDLIENLADGVRLIAGLVTLVIMAGLLLFTFGATHVASQASEELAHTAQELGKDAIRAQREAERNRELAKDGWGYNTGTASFETPTDPDRNGLSPRSRRDEADDWGTAD